MGKKKENENNGSEMGLAWGLEIMKQEAKLKKRQKEEMHRQEMRRVMEEALKRKQDPFSHLRELEQYFKEADARVPRVPLCYGYARVSTDRQYNQGDSINVQIERIEQYYKINIEPTGTKWGGIEFDKQGVSAKRIPFLTRPAGRILLSKLQPGDHVIFDKLDRAWRNMLDFCTTIKFLAYKGINVHFISLQIDTSKPWGLLIANVMAGLAEWDSDQRAERIRERNAWARKRGLKRSYERPIIGTKFVIDNDPELGKVTKLAWNTGERELMAEIVRLVEDEHLSFEAVSLKLGERLLEFDRPNKLNGRPDVYKKGTPEYEEALRPWKKLNGRTIKYYQLERFYRDNNIDDVRDIPVRASVLASMYCKTLGLPKRPPNWPHHKKNAKTT